MLSWRDGAPGRNSLPPATHYSVSVNDTALTEVEASVAGGEEMYSVLLTREMLEPAVGGRMGEWHFVAVRAVHNGLESHDSDKIRISPVMLKKLFACQGAEDWIASNSKQNGHSPKMANRGGEKSLQDYAADDDSEEDVEESEEGHLPQGAVGTGEWQPARSREVVTNLLDLAGDEDDEDDSSGEIEAGG